MFHRSRPVLRPRRGRFEVACRDGAASGSRQGGFEVHGQDGGANPHLRAFPAGFARLADDVRQQVQPAADAKRIEVGNQIHQVDVGVGVVAVAGLLEASCLDVKPIREIESVSKRGQLEHRWKDMVVRGVRDNFFCKRARQENFLQK